MDNVDKDDRNVNDESSSDNSLRNSVDDQDGDEKNVGRKPSSDNSPRSSVDEKNVNNKSSSENSPRSSIDKQNEEDGQNVMHEPSLENSPKGTLDNQEKEENSPRGSVYNLEKKDVAHKSSLGNSPRDIVNDQNEDEKNLTNKSSAVSSPREKDVAHESSLEKSSRDILDNQDEDDQNVSHKSSSDSSPREVFDNQEEDEINETHKSSLESSSSRGTLEHQDDDEKNVAHKSSSEDSPRSTHDNDGKNLTRKSSPEDSPRGTNDNQENDENHVSDKSISENSPRDTRDSQGEDEKHVFHESNLESSQRNTLDDQEKYEDHVTHKSSTENSPRDILNTEVGDKKNAIHKSTPKDSPRNTNEVLGKDKEELECKMEMLKISKDSPKNQNESERERMDDTRGPISDTPNDTNETAEEGIEQEEADPVFDGTEAPELKGSRSSSSRSLDSDSEAPAPALSEKAVAIKNFVKGKGSVAVSSLIRRLSCKKDDYNPPDEEEKNANAEENSSPDSKQKEVPEKAGGATWNPLTYIKIGRDTDIQNKPEQTEDASVENTVAMPVMKGTIIVYTRLGCQECKQVRLFMHQKRLKYVEINIDIYPTRKLELEKNTGSCAVPRVYFNDFLIGGLSELKAMDESGKLDEKIDYVMKEEPSSAAPLPPLSGEDDETGRGKIDELASIVRKMKETIVLRDKFCKMRKFTNCFLGSDAVDFLSEDQYLEREAAVEFGRKLASKHFFRHILDENIFEDGNHLYRFLEHDPIILTQCYNISWGTIDVKPKPITEIASRLRFLCFAIFEAYVSEDGRHVDYRSIHSSEEFQRYLRIVEELQRVDLDGSSREEKLAFFINLYNMMAIHAILTWGYPVGVMDRRRFLGDFKYVVGGCTYSLSAIQNGILRGNQRPPYNLMKPFGLKDKRFKVALPFTEPLVHFALVCGTRSGPALRCFSPGNIDKELVEAAHDFMRNGGLVVDIEAKVASVSRILWWYSMDFGKTELEVLKHAANYLEADKSEELLELVANTQLKVAYQPYDWSLNC